MYLDGLSLNQSTGIMTDSGICWALDDLQDVWDQKM